MTNQASLALMKFLSQLARRLGVSEHTYIVGGAVRNFVLKAPVKDIDVVIDTVGLNGLNSEWFAKEIAKAIPAKTTITTNQYGVAILHISSDWDLEGNNLQGEDIEIANARTESYGQGGYTPDKVEPATIRDDVYRREFTFNTLLWRLYDLAEGPDKAEILDLSGCGLKDLTEGVMRCPSSPDKTFSDDPSRMIRAIKFLIKYNFRISPEVERSIIKNKSKIKNIPHSHLSNMLITTFLREPTGKRALLEMQRLGLLEEIREIAESQKPFRDALANWADRESKVDFIFDLMDMGLPSGKRLSFLTPEQQDRVRALTVKMTHEEADRYLLALQQPGKVLDTRALMVEFNLSGPAMRTLQDAARLTLLSDPGLMNNPAQLQGLVRARLIQGRTAMVENDPLVNRVANQYMRVAVVSSFDVVLGDKKSRKAHGPSYVYKSLQQANQIWDQVLEAATDFNSLYVQAQAWGRIPEDRLLGELRGRSKELLDKEFFTEAAHPLNFNHPLGQWVYRNFGPTAFKPELRQNVRESVVLLQNEVARPGTLGGDIPLTRFVTNLLDSLDRYAAHINKLLGSAGPHHFKYQGFQVLNPDRMPDRILKQLLSGVDFVVALFKRRGATPVLQETIRTILLRHQSDGETAHGRYYSGRKEIEMMSVAAGLVNVRMLREWVSEVFLHEVGHHIHLSLMHPEAKEIWDSGWAPVEEARKLDEASAKKIKEVSFQDRERFWNLLVKFKGVLQTIPLKGLDRMKFHAWLRNPTVNHPLVTEKQLRWSKPYGVLFAEFFQDPEGYVTKTRGEVPNTERFDRVMARLWDLYKGRLAVNSGWESTAYPILTDEQVAEYKADSAVAQAIEALEVPTDYAKTNEREDFAESFVAFMSAPERLSGRGRYRMQQALSLSGLYGKQIMRLAKHPTLLRLAETPLNETRVALAKFYHDKYTSLATIVAQEDFATPEFRRHYRAIWQVFEKAGYGWSNYVLKNLAVPPGKAKALEMATRLFTKTNNRVPDLPKWFEANEARLALLDSAISWPERTSGGDELFEVGPFNVHNTIQASGRPLEETKGIILKAVRDISNSGIPGLKAMLYGDLYLVGRLLKRTTAAWYNPSTDEVHLRVGIRGVSTAESARHLVHEIGHRFYRKRLGEDVKRAWLQHHNSLSQQDVRVPPLVPGLAVPVDINGKVCVLGEYHEKSGKFEILEASNGKSVGFVLRYTLFLWFKEALQRDGFPTPYAATNQEEHFCDALSMYAIGTLKGEHLTAFETIVLGQTPLTRKVAQRYLDKVAARPIKIDKAKVAQLAKKIVPEISRRLRFRGDPTDPLNTQRGFNPNTWAFDVGKFEIKDVKGRLVVVTVEVSTKNANLNWSHARRFVSSGFIRHKGRLGQDAIKYLMGITLDSARSPKDFLDNMDRVEKEIYSILIHEVTHLMDIIRAGEGSSRHLDEGGGGIAVYHNDPTEIRAFMQQIVDEIVEDVRKRGEDGDLWAGATMDLFEGALEQSTTWNRVRKSLEPRSKNTLLKGVYTGFQDELPQLQQLWPPFDWSKEGHSIIGLPCKPHYRLAESKFKKKKEVPKADGSGTTTVYEYSERQIQNRNRDKAKRVETLRSNLHKLHAQIKKDLKSKDTKTRLCALAVGLMNDTYERVGNAESAKDGHFGVTGWQAKHVKMTKGKATFSYVGKSGVKQEKVTTDSGLLTVLKEVLSDKTGSDDIFEFDGVRVDSSAVNNYLSDLDLGITAKDIRGLHANREMQTQLKAIRSKGGKLPSDKTEREKKLKEEFKKALEITADAVGHEPATLKSQYLVPGLEDTYLSKGEVPKRLDKQATQNSPVTTKYLQGIIQAVVSDPQGWGSGSPTANALQKRIHNPDFEDVSSLFEWLEWKGVPKEELDLARKVPVPRVPRVPVTPTNLDALQAFEDLTGKGWMSSGLDLDDTSASRDIAAWTQAVKGLKGVPARLWSSEVKKVRFSVVRGSEEASWAPGGVMVLVVGKGRPLSPPLLRSVLLHELGHAFDEKTQGSKAYFSTYGIPPYLSGIAQVNGSEDFAETFRGFFESVNQVRSKTPHKYRDMASRLGVKTSNLISEVVRAYYKRATKTQHQKDDEDVREMLKPPPNKKPAREDLRRNKMRTEDQDLSKADGEKDLSLNYKKVGFWRWASEEDHQIGDIWKTEEGRWSGKNPNGNVKSFEDRDQAESFAKGKSSKPGKSPGVWKREDGKWAARNLDGNVEIFGDTDRSKAAAEKYAESHDTLPPGQAAANRTRKLKKGIRVDRKDLMRQVEGVLNQMPASKALKLQKILAEKGPDFLAALGVALDQAESEAFNAIGDHGITKKMLSDAMKDPFKGLDLSEIDVGDDPDEEDLPKDPEGASDAPKSKYEGAAQSLAQALVQQNFNNKILLNPAFVDGEPLSKVHLDANALTDRSEAAFKQFKKTTPEARAKAAKIAAEELASLEEDTPQHEELQRIIDGLHAAMEVHGETWEPVGANGKPLRDPLDPKMRILFMQMVAQGDVRVLLSDSSDPLAVRESVRDAMGRLSDAELNEISADTPWSGLAGLLSGPNKVRLDPAVANLVRGMLRDLGVNKLTLNQSIKKSLSGAGSSSTNPSDALDEAKDKFSDKKLETSLSGFLECLLKSKSPEMCSEQGKAVKRAQLEGELEKMERLAKEMGVELDPTDPLVAGLRHAVKTGDDSVLDEDLKPEKTFEEERAEWIRTITDPDEFDRILKMTPEEFRAMKAAILGQSDPGGT